MRTTDTLLVELAANLTRARALPAAHDAPARPRSNRWSIAECLEHIVLTNRALLGAMTVAIGHRRDPATTPAELRLPFFARLLLRVMEPPVRVLKLKSPPSTVPVSASSVPQWINALEQSHEHAAELMRQLTTADINSIRFPDLFNPRIQHTIAVGLAMLVAHERRHLWQAERIVESNRRGATRMSSVR